MVDFSSFSSFIDTTLGETIGEGECWDYINLIWNHLGNKYWTYPPDDPSSTNHGVKWGWIIAECRTLNTLSGLTQVTNVSNIKQGDIVITADSVYGHAGFAKTDYDSINNRIIMYSQNYAGDRFVQEHVMDMTNFLGAWRYDAWQPTPPTPTPTSDKKRFPFVLYARKLRNQ